MREANVSVDDTEFEAMGIGDLLSMSRAAGLRSFEELSCRGNGGVVQAEVESRYDEDRLSSLDCVDRWEQVTETDEGYVYVIAFTAPDLPPELAEEADDLVGTCDPVIEDRGASISLVGDQETIAGTIDQYESAGVSPDLRKLGSYDGSSDPLDELTDRQREVLETAHEMGYFDVPRTTSTAAIADELDLDPSTVTEHLQRAEHNVFDQLL